MAEEKKTTEEMPSEKQASSNTEDSPAPAEAQQQQPEQQPQQQQLEQQQLQPEQHQQSQSDDAQSSQPAEAGGTVEATEPTVDIAAMLGSIRVPEITAGLGMTPEELIQPAHINGDLSEEDQMRIASKTAMFPDIPSASTQHATAVSCTAGEMEVAQLKVKVICQEKNILALRMELKSAELQVEAKNKIDSKKTRLVELLDNKLKTVESRNTRLLEMVEQMIKDKDSSTNRLKEATQKMQDLSDRLVSSERLKTELMQVNAELRKMLESLETKGSQIAKLAIEKVTKYKDANDQMQLELTGLKDEAKTTSDASAADQSAKVVAAAAAAVQASCTEETSAACDELWCKIVELQKQITSALQKVNGQSLTAENLQEAIEEASAANTALGESVEAAREKTGQGLSALSVENNQLRALVGDFDTVRRENEGKEAKCQEILNDHKNYVTAKDKETVELKEELQRLKGAIGQLIGSK